MPMPGTEKGDNTEGGAMKLGASVTMKMGGMDSGMTRKKMPVKDNKNYSGFSSKKKK